MQNKTILDKLYVSALVFVILVLIAVFLFTGDNFQLVKSLFDSSITDEQLRQTTDQLGWAGYLTFTLICALQVFCPFLPAQPIQVLAGIAYGVPVGLACCGIGFLLGCLGIYMLCKLFGNRLQGFFMRDTQVDMAALAHSNKLTLILILLYLIPALPYAMICFFAVSIGFSLGRYFLVNSLGALPSILISVALGNMTITSNSTVTLAVFAVLIVLMILILWKRTYLFGKLAVFAAKPPYSSKTTVRRSNRFLLRICYWGVKFYFFLRGIKVKTTNKAGKLQTPCVVLCNHGSFIDFYYSAKLILNYDFNFISARLYFYHKWLGRIMKALGCFPKSMFATDMESTKNCMRVIKEGRVLAMMPEARLSTAGQFEDIQDRTYSFLKKLEVPIYTIHISGDYLADPKWGKGLRRGSKVEAVLEQLYTPEQLAQHSPEQIKAQVEKRLNYDEFQWLASRPEIHYKHKRLAEGLENILSLCPVCGKKHTIFTKGNGVFCENCGPLTQMDDRYLFQNFKFENFSQWYNWQKAQLRQQIQADPDFCLHSQVEYRLPDSSGKAMTRHAGTGQCTLDRTGLTYTGTRDGQEITKHFPLAHIYRLLFGAGENFEIYSGTEIQFFVPEEKRSAVDWYMASSILYDLQAEGKTVSYE